MTEPAETLRVGDCRACRARVAGLHGAHDALTCVCTEPCEGCETSPAERPDLPAAIASLRRQIYDRLNRETEFVGCPSATADDLMRLIVGDNSAPTIANPQVTSGTAADNEADTDLVQVGWYCWRCRGLNTSPCRSDAVPVHVPAGWATDMEAEVQRHQDGDYDGQPSCDSHEPSVDSTDAADGGNAEDCLACAGVDVPYPWLCPGHDTPGPAPAPATEPAAETPAYAWAQTIHTTDAGHTIRIPGTHHSPAGDETREILVRREDVPVLRDMLNSALAPTSPPPPGSTREQLPDAMLTLIRDRLPDYTSTACQTADTLALASPYPYRGPLHDEIREHTDRLHELCRINQKFTGQICCCGCHPEKEHTP